MKKSILFVLILLWLMLRPMESSAEEYLERDYGSLGVGIEGEYIDSGYTEEGIYYEVYGAITIVRASEYVTVSRTIVYEGVIKPSNTIFWEEMINGEPYAGTLSLRGYSFMPDKTIATYTGKLYKS